MKINLPLPKTWAIVAGLALAASMTPLAPGIAEAAQIKVVVNRSAITDIDISRRTAFLKLQRRTGNLASMAREELIDEALKTQELQRREISIPDAEVDAAFARFASNNKLKPAQMSQILDQAGVGTTHFKNYIKLQIGWNRILGQRFRAESSISEQDLVAKMLERGGQKPSTTEYTLQQVIFVVPEAKRGAILGQRTSQANNMRARFAGCEGSYNQAKALRDVTIRELGRVLQPELPPDWKDLVVATKPGGTTSVRQTARGAEFIAVCKARAVSDDKAAEMVFRAEGASDDAADELSEKYLSELREAAQISNR